MRIILVEIFRGQIKSYGLMIAIAGIIIFNIYRLFKGENRNVEEA